MHILPPMSDAPTRTSGGEIVRRAGVVATGTLTSRILGAVRDAVVAAVFALAATDAFWLAFTIPNALRVLLGEGAVSAAFVPVFTEVRERESNARAKDFYRNLIGAMAVVLLLVTVVGVVGAPWIVKAYAWGFQRDEALFETTVALTRMLFPYIFLMGLSPTNFLTLSSPTAFRRICSSSMSVGRFSRLRSFPFTWTTTRSSSLTSASSR